MRCYLLRHVWRTTGFGVSPGPGCVVELGHELAVGCARGGEFLAAFFEAAAVGGVEEWARADATPAEEEITRTRSGG